MNIQQILDILPILQKMIELKLPVRKAYELFKLIKLVEEQKQFFINQEKKLVESYDISFTEKGDIIFKSEEDQSEFIKFHNDLRTSKLSEIEPINLSFEDVKDLMLSVKDFQTLENIIIFS